MSANNIVRCYFDSPESVRASGMVWYASAMELAREISPDSPEHGAGVIAALSPMMNWPRNKELARQAFNGIRPACLGKNADKAMRIVAGEMPLDVIGGAKVVSFFHNIMANDVADAVTIDRHAMDIAMDTPGHYSANGAPGKRLYAKLVAEYLIAAKVISRLTGIHHTATQVQAITWTHWRMTKAQMYFGEGV